MLSKISGASAYFINPPADSTPVDSQDPAVDQTPSDAPYLLRHVHAEKRPFERQDPDTLSKMFKPMVRIGESPRRGLDFNQLQKIAEPPKSNGLGIFLDPATGLKYYLKKSPDEKKAGSELLALDLACLFGLTVPRGELVAHDGNLYIASMFVEELVLANEQFPNCAFEPRQLAKIAAYCPAVQQALVVAALLNNRDILGIGCDNFGFVRRADGSPEPVFLDFGGSFDFRATSGNKTFDGAAKEFLTMTEPTLQADSHGGGPNGLVFGSTPPAVLRGGLEKILAVSDAEIMERIQYHVGDTQRQQYIFNTLVARRNSIQAQIDAAQPNRMAQKIDSFVDYGITCAYGWDDEDADIGAQVKSWAMPAIMEYVHANLHLLATAEGQLELSAHVTALVEPELDRLLIQKNGERASPPTRRVRAPQAEPASTPIITDVTDMEAEPD